MAAFVRQGLIALSPPQRKKIQSALPILCVQSSRTKWPVAWCPNESTTAGSIQHATRVPKGIFQLVRLYWIALGARGNTRNREIMGCSVTRLSRRIRGDYISRRIRPQSLMTGRFDGFESPTCVQGGSRRWQFHLQISAEPRPRILTSGRTEQDPFNKRNKSIDYLCLLYYTVERRISFVQGGKKSFVNEFYRFFDLMRIRVESFKVKIFFVLYSTREREGNRKRKYNVL